MKKLCIFSGDCFKGECGKPTGMVDIKGHQLCVGDVVVIWHQDYPDPNIPLNVCDHFSAIVEGGHTTYSDGKIVSETGKDCFVMGLRATCNSCDPKSDIWSIMKIKSWTDVVEGERLGYAGLNYKMFDRSI